MIPLLENFLAFTLAGNEPEQVRGRTSSGIEWRWRGAGILECAPATRSELESNIVLSAGIHGDETAPIEILDALVANLARGATPLRARLLILLGNIEAMRAGRRYLDDDLNRLFSGVHRAVPNSLEAPRAAALESAVTEFFAATTPAVQRVHLDLHTSIRPSLFERFALLPAREQPYERSVFERLGAFGIEAVLRQCTGSTTFAHYSSSAHGALAATLELGKARPFGHNDLKRFQAAADGLQRLIGGARCELNGALPKIFDVVGQIKKCSDAFEFFVEDNAPNFTSYPLGTLIARDGSYTYRVTHAQERIVFPNPSVKVGLRAGLMAVESEIG